MKKPRQKSRQVSKQETRDALIAAGLAEFAAHGFDNPSLDGICERAGFTRGAFYVHFKGRDDFFEAVMQKAFGVFLDTVIASGDDAHDLEATVERFADVASTGKVIGAGLESIDIDIHRVLDACARSPVLRQNFVALLQGGAARVASATRRGQKAGTIRDDVDADGLGELLALLALGIATAVDTGVPINPPKLKQVMLRLLGAASTPKKAAKSKTV